MTTPTTRKQDDDRGTQELPEALVTLLKQVAEDAASLLSCNCSMQLRDGQWQVNGMPATDEQALAHCDGNCTHGMATRALAALKGSPSIALMRYPLGTRIETRIEDFDTDSHGHERKIPIGALGILYAFDGELFDVAWANGGWTRWTVEELDRDAERR